MRDELLDTVARVGGRLGEMRLDTYLDVDQAVARYLELIKVAALIERAREGQTLETALPEVNEILAQCATPEQREIFEESGLDSWLRDTGRDPAELPGSTNGSDASLDPFIPRRGRGLMLSASDIDTYRICPLKYKFARVFRIPQEPTINQRFGIVMHQVLERFHTEGGGSLERLRELFEISWRRSGFGDSDDELQFRERAVEALERYWRQNDASEAEPVWFERSFAFKIGPHLLRGRVDRVDRHPDGSFELIDYKTGKAKTEDELREDVQLSVYQMGARESWRLETSAQSYFYVLSGEKVPVEHSRRGARPRARDGLRDRRRDPQAALRADALAGGLPLLRLPDHLSSRREVGVCGAVANGTLRGYGDWNVTLPDRRRRDPQIRRRRDGGRAGHPDGRADPDDHRRRGPGDRAVPAHAGARRPAGGGRPAVPLAGRR